jgi:pimeloyl-ACP methyl ester carboxylesterase
VDSVAVVGHSFGGATAVASALHHESVSLAVSLDGWLFPLPLPYQDPAEDFTHNASLVFINRYSALPRVWLTLITVVVFFFFFFFFFFRCCVPVSLLTE